jgi:hypothetical protein
LEKQFKAVRVTGYVQPEKLLVWNAIKRDLENKNGQKLNDSFVLNYILGQLGEVELGIRKTITAGPVVINEREKK